MKPNELKAKLGRFAGLLLYPAYSKAYWRQVLLKDLNVQPERLKAIIASAEDAKAELDQVIKELEKTMYVYRYNWDAASMKLDINTLTPDEDEAGYHGEFNQACYSEEDMQELVDEAREKGLHVIGWDK